MIWTNVAHECVLVYLWLGHLCICMHADSLWHYGC